MNDAAAIPPHIVEAFEEGQRLRGGIANSYAQIEFLLGDLILRSRVFSEYGAFTSRLPSKVKKRISVVLAMLDVAGPLTPYAHRLRIIITKFEESHEIRNLLAHGFSIFNRTPSGDGWFEFRKHHVENGIEELLLIRTFRLGELEAEQQKLSDVAQDAMLLLREIHDRYGWSK